MLMHEMMFPLTTILLGILLIVIAVIALREPENRKLTWPWVVGIVGIIGLVINLIGFIVERTVDVYEVTEQAHDFAARVEESLAPLQPALNIWPVLQGAILLVVGIVILLKPKNREKTWPWIIGVIGLLMLISNGIRFLI